MLLPAIVQTACFGIHFGAREGERGLLIDANRAQRQPCNLPIASQIRPALIELPNALLSEPAVEYRQLSRDILISSFCGAKQNAYKKKCKGSDLPACRDQCVREQLCGLFSDRRCFLSTKARKHAGKCRSDSINARSRAEVSVALTTCRLRGYAPCKFHSNQPLDTYLKLKNR